MASVAMLHQNWSDLILEELALALGEFFGRGGLAAGHALHVLHRLVVGGGSEPGRDEHDCQREEQKGQGSIRTHAMLREGRFGSSTDCDVRFATNRCRPATRAIASTERSGGRCASSLPSRLSDIPNFRDIGASISLGSYRRCCHSSQRCRVVDVAKA